MTSIRPTPAASAPSSGGASSAQPGRKRRPARPIGARIGRYAARALLALVFVAAAFVALTPAGRSGAKAAMLLPALITQQQPGPLLLSGDDIRHTTTTLTAQGGTVYLDVYEPVGAPPPIPGAREGVVIIPGVGDNRNDHQLRTLSEALARSGVVVMDMTTPTLMHRDLSPVDGDAVVRAFERLSQWPGVAPDRVGIFGISAGDALACLAAASPAIRDRVTFLMLFGGFYDARTLLRDFGRRALVVDQIRAPVYLLHDRTDQYVPFTESREFDAALTQFGHPHSYAELGIFQHVYVRLSAASAARCTTARASSPS